MINEAVLAVSAWLHAGVGHVRGRVGDRLSSAGRREGGAVGLEYVILAAAAFVVVVALAAVITAAIQNRSDVIEP